MFWFLVIGITVIALAFIIAEVVIVPGGILGIFGGLLLIYAIYLPYSEGYTIGAHINAAAIFITLIIMLFTAIKHKAWRRVELKTSIDSKVREDYRYKLAVGDMGVCMSRLTPIGSVKFANEVLEAKSDVGFLDPHTEVEIISIQKNEIIVKPLNK